jgi:CRP/FNR family cyclic AMP-dependent transcriptional regulator
MAMLSSQDLIVRVPLFARLNPSQAQALASSAVKRRYKRGEAIVEQDKHANALFIILAGRARVVMKDELGREVILAVLREGDCIGEMSVIDSQTHSATVTAEVVTDILILERDGFMRCLQESPDTAMAVMRGLVQRLRSADRKIGSLALNGVYVRVANTLIESAEDRGDGVLLIKEKVSRQDVAKMVGASREMVSRVMKEFEEQGFIETLDNGGVLIRERRARPR